MEKQKIIEEMAKDLEPFLTLHREVYVSANRKEKHGWMLSEEDNKVIAEHLISKGWVKFTEDSFVLTNDNAEELANLIVTSPQMQSVMSDLIKAWQKEMAEKFFAELFYIASINHSDIANILAWAKDKAKQFGVEIKE